MAVVLLLLLLLDMPWAVITSPQIQFWSLQVFVFWAAVLTNVNYDNFECQQDWIISPWNRYTCCNNKLSARSMLSTPLQSQLQATHSLYTVASDIKIHAVFLVILCSTGGSTDTARPSSSSWIKSWKFHFCWLQWLTTYNLTTDPHGPNVTTEY